MILPGGGSRLQTLGGLAAQLFDSTFRTLYTNTHTVKKKKVPVLLAVRLSMYKDTDR